MKKLTIDQLSIVICSAAFFLLALIWVLPGTIGIRHYLLGIGLLSGLNYIWVSRSKFIFDITCLPLILIGTLFLWVGIHFFFFSLDPVLEIKEIKGIWLRSFGGVVIAIALAVAIKEFKKIKVLFFLAILVTPLINIGAYLYLSHSKGIFLEPKVFVPNNFFKKVETAFFGSVAISVFLAYALNLLSQKIDFKKALIILMVLITCMLLALSSALVASKNGVAIALFLFSIFFICLNYLLIIKTNQRKAYIFSGLFFLIGFFAIKNYHQESAYPGWGSIFLDIKVASQIEKYPAWKDPHLYSLPLNENSVPVAGNSYYRIAWAVVGVHLLANDPLGYGSVNNSFKGMLNHQKVEHNVPGQTHSGWIDFALGFGVPGILIIILAQLSIIYLGLKNKTKFSVIGVWICIALLPLGVIAEISYKQYFEATLFFITFAATMVWNTQSDKA